VQRTYRRKFSIAYAGMPSGIGLPRVRSVENTADAKAEVWEVPIPASPVASTTYTLVVDGRTVSFTTDGTPTQTELEAGLLSAIRQSEIYDSVNVTLNALLRRIVLERKLLGVAMVITGTNLSPTKTVTASISTLIPFGSIIAIDNTIVRGSNEIAAGRITRSTVAGIGVVMATHASEKVGIGPTAVSGIQPLEVMDVVTRTLALEGIWTRYSGPTGTTNIADTAVFQCVDAGTEGAASISAGTAVTALPGAVFASNVEVDPNGDRIALVALG